MIRIKNSKSGTTTVDIEGTIGVPEQWQFEEPAGRVATYEKFRRSIEDISRIGGGEVVINIRSTGGDVGDALLIYDALTALPNATITTRCWGYVASAATIIAQAASPGRREISTGALYLVHNCVGNCEGNAEDLQQSQQMLTKTDERIAGIYARRSGRRQERFKALMAENNGGGRWLSPQETIAEGLADRVIEGSDDAPAPGKGKRTPVQPPANGVDLDVMRHTQNRELDDLRRRITTLESENRQLRARPTELRQIEDPSHDRDNTRSLRHRELENMFL